MTESVVCRAKSVKSFAGLSIFREPSEYEARGALSDTSANMCQVVHNFRRPLRICGKWCRTFGGLYEYVPSDAQLSDTSANMCQVVHNFRRLLRICGKWCRTFGGLYEYVPSDAQLPEASANLCQMVHNYINCFLRMGVSSLSRCVMTRKLRC